jgi:hypothetical protein
MLTSLIHIYIVDVVVHAIYFSTAHVLVASVVDVTVAPASVAVA